MESLHDVETALGAEVDIDQNHIRAVLVGGLQGLRTCRRRADDGHARGFEHPPRRRAEGSAVVHDQCATVGAGHAVDSVRNVAERHYR